MGQSYRELIAWQKAVSLVTKIYQLTRTFPADERFGLIAQVRRAAVSVASNIAEGQARYSKKDFVHFLRHSRGSLAEIDTQLFISRNLGYTTEEACTSIQQDIDELGRILSGLIASMQEEAARAAGASD